MQSNSRKKTKLLTFKAAFVVEKTHRPHMRVTSHFLQLRLSLKKSFDEKGYSRLHSDTSLREMQQSMHSYGEMHFYFRLRPF